ncbi:hypothetical protein [Clostridium coskatii]|uniref:Bacterial Ig domain-containing protein n=1 Tax=Clostridium coskatii TaxID=1705578 RepID=A0A168NF86_9CLOT|nr:hypothetical protein [Clostridium coskatii]OAA86350.1 hypothetical protein WX73_02844 [Clostridium coskatii]OAA86368.1 hypothetical protein WX73_02862 [Clostridium coskatii]OBR95065.1 hypothetical protein CLCOS_17700 [Clostridium coskatii]
MNENRLNVFDKHRCVKNICLIAALTAGLVGSSMLPPISKESTVYNNVAMAAGVAILAPTISVSGNPTSWQNTDATISITAADENGVASITLPDGTVVNGSTASFKAVQNGSYTVKALDKAGNVATQIITVNKIDKTAPIAPTIIKNEDDYGINITMLPGNDIDSGVKEVDYSVDEGSYELYSKFPSNFCNTIMLPRFYIIKAKTIDNAGNESKETFLINNNLPPAKVGVTLINVAGKTLAQSDIDAAQAAIDSLPQGVDKAKYNIQLRGIRQRVQAATAQQIVKANYALMLTSRTRLKVDYDYAESLVQALPDSSSKTNLQNTLNLILKYLK